MTTFAVAKIQKGRAVNSREGRRPAMQALIGVHLMVSGGIPTIAELKPALIQGRYSMRYHISSSLVLLALLIIASPAVVANAENLVIVTGFESPGALRPPIVRPLIKPVACRPTDQDPQGQCMNTCWERMIRCKNSQGMVDRLMGRCDSAMDACTKACGC
jgi:hypothetical protein